MRQTEDIDGADTVVLARECFDRIAVVLEETIGKAELLDAQDMLERLIAAKAAADRGSELIKSLALMLESERLPNRAPTSN
jgi:hypothetical protein